MRFEVCYGVTFSVAPTWAGAAYSAYSGVEIATGAGTIATVPIATQSWYCAASNQTKESAGRDVQKAYGITLDAAGANRAFGTLSILATGIGGSSACRATINWKEIR